MLRCSGDRVNSARCVCQKQVAEASQELDYVWLVWEESERGRGRMKEGESYEEIRKETRGISSMIKIKKRI
jgi:hypothetical protein